MAGLLDRGAPGASARLPLITSHATKLWRMLIILSRLTRGRDEGWIPRTGYSRELSMVSILRALAS